jgi:hypothetical protein
MARDILKIVRSVFNELKETSNRAANKSAQLLDQIETNIRFGTPSEKSKSSTRRSRSARTAMV